MRKNIKDITGRKFGRLTAIKFWSRKNHASFWLFKCECYNYHITSRYRVEKEDCTSCGCGWYERPANFKHGLCYSRIYRLYRSLLARCYYKKDKAFERYCGRGIKVCKEWKNNFKKFYDWAINNGYKDKLTIDRIDNDKGYFPKNCRWITVKEQCNNKRNNRLLTFNGKTQTLTQWAKELKISNNTIEGRLRLGWSIEKALAFPVTKSNFERLKFNKQWKENHDNS
jgi:hypothetical protein